MGKDKRLWRKLVKKLQRKRKRQQFALELSSLCSLKEIANDLDTNNIDTEDVLEGETLGVVGGCPDGDFFLSQDEWELREEEAKLEAIMKQIETERLVRIEAENQRMIREEWEAKQEYERKLKEEKELQEKQLKEKQEAEFNQLLSFLSGDIEIPPTKYLLPDHVADEENTCYYYSKTAVCRFYDRCTKEHTRPILSTAILIPNFFSHFKLEQSLRDEYDSDLGLEYEDKELYKEFLEFYNDVVPELRKYGTLVQFKVCCNLEPHLRGNVYMQYRTIKEALEAYRKFNGRFYNGKQLSLQFIKMDSWRSAICGAFLRKACLKGRTCSYLHVFRNPTKEFVKADHDWKESQNHRPSTLDKSVPKSTGDSSYHNNSLKRGLSPPSNKIESNQRRHKPRQDSKYSNVSSQSHNMLNISKSSSKHRTTDPLQHTLHSLKRGKKHKKEKKKSKKHKKEKKREKKQKKRERKQSR